MEAIFEASNAPKGEFSEERTRRRWIKINNRLHGRLAATRIQDITWGHSLILLWKRKKRQNSLSSFCVFSFEKIIHIRS